MPHLSKIFVPVDANGCANFQLTLLGDKPGDYWETRTSEPARKNIGFNTEQEMSFSWICPECWFFLFNLGTTLSPPTVQGLTIHLLEQRKKSLCCKWHSLVWSTGNFWSQKLCAGWTFQWPRGKYNVSSNGRVGSGTKIPSRTDMRESTAHSTFAYFDSKIIIIIINIPLLIP